MARVLKNKELVNTRLATNYGGWVYCETLEMNGGIRNGKNMSKLWYADNIK